MENIFCLDRFTAQTLSVDSLCLDIFVAFVAEDFVWWLFGDSAQLARLKAAQGKTFKIALFSCAPYDKDLRQETYPR
eukprot:1302715-Amphidinium_carterae.1